MITTLDLPQSTGTLRLSTVCSIFETSTPPPIYPTAQTYAQRLSSQRKKKSASLGNEVPSLKKSSALLLIKRINHPSIPLRPVVSEWFILTQITGLCCTEYAQKYQTSFKEHEYPSGKRVVKAFISSDWKFYNNKERLVLDTMEVQKKLKMTFQIQKNRQNGQSITLVADDAHQDICPVQAARRIFLRAKKLGQSDSEPMGVFVNKFDIKKYLTGGKIAKVLRSVAKKVHPDWYADELSHISSHSGRVRALVLLDKAGMSPAFMTIRLCWMGDSYKLYLRDTSILQHKHINALNKESDEIVKLLGSNKDMLPNIVPVDDDMGDYLTPRSNSFFIFFSFFLFPFFLFFCMLASHNGVVITTRLVALTCILLMRPLVTRSIHAQMEVWLMPELLGTLKTGSFGST